MTKPTKIDTSPKAVAKMLREVLRYVSVPAHGDHTLCARGYALADALENGITAEPAKEPCAFALCENDAVTTVPYSPLGSVPACQRCADLYNGKGGAP